MRVLVVHRYYWPDKAPCAGIMRWVAKHLAADGCEVDVLTSQPSYRSSSHKERRAHVEQLDGVLVRRLVLPTENGRPVWRIVNALHLGIRLLLQAVIRRYDVIVVATVPPILGGFFSALAAKLTGARFVYYCMDLHPEIGRLSGDFSNPLLYRVLERIDDWNCRQASPVLVHSEDMRKTLGLRPRGSEYRIEIMNNFSIPSEDIPDEQADLPIDLQNGNRLTMIYAGNLGRFQCLESIMEAMGRISNRKDIELILLGDGVAKSPLKNLKEKLNANVQFLEYQPVAVAKNIIRLCDIGLVTLIPEMYRYAYPSKTMTYLEQGCPIIAAVEAESELARAMNAEGYGFSVSVGDVDALARLLIKLADDDSWRAPMRRSAVTAFDKHFSSEVVLAKWSQLLLSNTPRTAIPDGK